jgi:hypothetical protein
MVVHLGSRTNQENPSSSMSFCDHQFLKALSLVQIYFFDTCRICHSRWAIPTGTDVDISGIGWKHVSILPP